MATELDVGMIRSIVKWELRQAPKGLFAVVHGGDRATRDYALSAIAECISKRLAAYTITNHVHRDQSDMGRLASAPDYSGKAEGYKVHFGATRSGRFPQTKQRSRIRADGTSIVSRQAETSTIE